MHKLLIAGLIFLCSSSPVVFAEDSPISSTLKRDFHRVCHSEKSALAVLTAVERDGYVAGAKIYNERKDCQSRYLGGKIVRVVRSAKVPSEYRIFTVIEFESYPGFYYTFASKDSAPGQ